MSEPTSTDEKTLSLSQAFQGQADALTEIAETLSMLNACIKKLTDNHIELSARVEKLEQESKRK